jgi:hypothetical protein
MPEEKKSIRVRIQNDGGTGLSTRITDVETGRPIEGVQQITLLLSPTKEPIKATLTVHSPHVDIVLDAEIERRCPYCGHSEAWFRHDRQPSMISGYSPEIVNLPKHDYRTLFVGEHGPELGQFPIPRESEADEQS